MSGDEVYAILSKRIKKLQISGGGVTDYRDLTGKPDINGITLIGSLSLSDLGIKEMSNTKIEEIIQSIGGL